MKLTYTIQVCNESRELFSLLGFLCKTIDHEEDDIHVVVDSRHVTDKVELVLDHFKDRIHIFRRPFDTFHENGQFHMAQARGEYIFGLDADEMPQELLIKNIKAIIEETKAEIIAVPRINIHPGATQAFIDASGFKVNEVGWINWPDYQMRIVKKCEHITCTEELHTKLAGTDKIVTLRPEPKIALWHIKSVEKQEGRWGKNGSFHAPTKEIYDRLM